MLFGLPVHANEKIILPEGRPSSIRLRYLALKNLIRRKISRPSNSLITKENILRELRNSTPRAKAIATAIERGEIGLNFLGPEMYAKATILHYGLRSREDIFLASIAYSGRFNRSLANPQIHINQAHCYSLFDAANTVVHEGDHFLRLKAETSGYVFDLENKAYRVEADFCRSMGLLPTFNSDQRIMNYVRTNYGNALLSWNPPKTLSEKHLLQQEAINFHLLPQK